MDKTKNMIFLSYRRSDFKGKNELIKKIKEAVERATGLSVFLDEESLGSGSFDDRITESVKGSYVFVPIVTGAYLEFGEEGGRTHGTDRVLMEYSTALVNSIKIVPILFTENNAETQIIGYNDARKPAERAVNGENPEEEDYTLLKKYLLKQNGIYLSALEEVEAKCGKLSELIFDSFCTGEKIPFFREYLRSQANKLDPINVFGDYNSNGITVENSYVPLTFFCHKTDEEREKENEKNIRYFENERIITGKTDIDGFFHNLNKERFAVIVGDAGQGKSTFLKKMCIELSKKADEFGLSKDEFFPLFFECKTLEPMTFDKKDAFLDELANDSETGRAALDAVLRNGKPLFVFDAMDEISPTQADKLLSAVYKYLIEGRDRVGAVFTTRPGQRLVAGTGDMTLDHTPKTVVRRYTVNRLDEAQRDKYIENLARISNKTDAEKSFKYEIGKKENVIDGYHEISRNPFMLFSVFSMFILGYELPENRFDAVVRVMEDVIRRDLNKTNCTKIKVSNIEVVLGNISFELYKQKDEGKINRVKRSGVECAEKIYRLDDSDKDDCMRIDEYTRIFESGKLYDENGFRHEFLASTYAAYYLYHLMKRQVKRGDDPSRIPELEGLSKDEDYWKSVTEALLCIIDRESDDSKTYLEPFIEKMQSAEKPDHDLLCRSVSQFTEHRPRAATLLLTNMLERGCGGMIGGNTEVGRFICTQGINPYEELFYYPAVYPFLQEYLHNLVFSDEAGESGYLRNELIKEVQAVFSEKPYEDLRELYKLRNDAGHHEIDRKLEEAAYRREKTIKGYFRIKDGTTEIESNSFGNNTLLTNVFIPESVTKIGNCALSGCTSLISVTIPDSVKKIEGLAFFGCTSLSSVIISDGVTGIGKSAFRNCSSLKSVIIPESVTEIDWSAFSDCTSLTSVVIPDSVNWIGDRAFYGCVSLKNIQMPDNALDIGGEVFSHCSSVTSITIPESVICICYGAFNGCTSLNSCIIPESVITIEDRAFSGCSDLTIYAPEGSYAEKYALKNNITFKKL